MRCKYAAQDMTSKANLELLLKTGLAALTSPSTATAPMLWLNAHIVRRLMPFPPTNAVEISSRIKINTTDKRGLNMMRIACS